MPVKNIYKDYASDSYYHIYNRGVNRAEIFKDEKDFIVFLSLLKRYLGKEVQRQQNREPHPNYHQQIDLLAFCLMKNHFHLFIYQSAAEAIIEFMRSLGVSYGMYFNKRYKRQGPIFQQRYKAVRIIDDSQLLHITRYIHMNPESYKQYEWSSLPYYLGRKQASWVQPGRILELFEGDYYMRFLDDFKHKRAELKALKEELADA